MTKSQTVSHPNCFQRKREKSQKGYLYLFIFIVFKCRKAVIKEKYIVIIAIIWDKCLNMLI